MLMELEQKKYLECKTEQSSVGVCRGGLGELFQGISMDEKDEIVIVSSVIPKYSWAYFTPCENGFSSLKDQRLVAPERTKSFRALELYCQLLGVVWPSGYWHFHSDLKVARGMASSTADIVAILRCASSYFNRILPIQHIIQILAQIERSDSVFLDRLALFCSSKHKIINQYPKMKPLYALYMHENSQVETDGTKPLLIDFYRQNYVQYSQLYRQAESALASGDLKSICHVSSKSAELSQEVLPKTHFQNIFRAQKQFKANGIITAHTGSVIGFLYCQQPDINTFESVACFYKELNSYCQYTEIGA